MSERSDPTDAACARVRERLEAYSDGALAPVEAARDAGHLEACAGCASALARLDTARAEAADALAADARGTAPEVDWLHAGLEARLDAACPPRRAPLVRLLGPPGDRAGAPVLVAAAAILALVALSASGALEGVGASVSRGLSTLDGLGEFLPELDALPGIPGRRDR